MKYDGAVIRLNSGLFLFILDPETNELMDGLGISDHKCYKDLKDNKLMVVNVIFKDGTLELDKIDLDEFIEENKFNIFIHIYDISLYSVDIEKYNSLCNTFEDIIKNGDFVEIALSCIEDSKKIEKHE